MTTQGKKRSGGRGDARTHSGILGANAALTGAQFTVSGLRVLVVDDNRPAADMLAMVLESLGNELRTAYDGQQATEVADSFKPDVILLDIGLPVMDGYETARCIRRQSRGREPVMIALSGRGEPDDREKSRLAGFTGMSSSPPMPRICARSSRE